MTATETQSPAAYAGELQMIPLADAHESPRNPRTYFSEAKLQELTDSIKAVGVRVPLLGRPRLQGGGVEIGAGHRRLRAAKRAGIAAVPVIVRDMTDLEFEDLLAFENGNREDLHPLEEATAWKAWMDNTLSDVPALIVKTGHKLGYVYARLKLLDAIDDAKQACWEEKIKPGHLVLIARRDPKDQRKALKFCERPEWDKDRPMVSTRELQTWMRKNLDLDLDRAPFPRDAPDLVPAAGTCVECPHRAGNAPDFNPLEDLPNICTRAACYDEKVDAHIEREKTRLQAESGELILISENSGPRAGEILRPGEWSEVFIGAGKPAGKAALVVEGGRKGFEIRVIVQERLQPTPPAPKPAPTPGMSAEEKKREAARLKEEREKAAERDRAHREEQARQRAAAEAKIEAEKDVRTRILAAILTKVKWPPEPADLWPLLDDIQLPVEMDESLRSIGIDPRQWDAAAVPRLSAQSLARLIVMVAVADDLESDWNYARGCDKLNATAKRYGVNPAEFRKPAKAVEDGTRREVIKQLPAVGAAKKPAPPAAAKPAAAKKPAPAKKAAKKKGGKK